MPGADSYHTLVLNADYRPLSYYPLSIWSWQEAIKAILMERVSVLSVYDYKVHSPSLALHIPSVISLKRYIPADRSKPAFTRYNIFLRDSFTCQYCGERFTYRHLTLDHVMPRSRGGDSSWENVVTACHDCNSRKSNYLPGKQFPAPLNTPHMPSAYELQQLSRDLEHLTIHESWEGFLPA